ncbi:MAG: hypothetical protein WC307_04840 [Candidatus Nanoarchaeia archaeon]|jgi:hypothetical protein
MSLYSRIKNGDFNATEELGLLAKTSKVNIRKLFTFIKKGDYSDCAADLATYAIGSIYDNDHSQVNVKKIIKALRHKKPKVRLRAGNAINQMVGHDYEDMSAYIPEIIKTANNSLFTDSIASTTKQMIIMYSKHLPEALVPYVFELFTNNNKHFNELSDIIEKLLIPKLSNDLLKKSLETLLELGELTTDDFIGNSYWLDKGTYIKPNFIIDQSPELIALVKSSGVPKQKKNHLTFEGKLLTKIIAKKIDFNYPINAIINVLKIKPVDFSIKLFSDNTLALYSPIMTLLDEK